VRVSLIAIAILLVAPAVSWQEPGFEARDTVSWTFPGRQADTVSVTVLCGGVELTAWADTTVRLEVERLTVGSDEASALTARDQFELEVDGDGRTLRADFLTPEIDGCSCFARIKVPAGMRTELVVVDGRVRVLRPRGRVLVHMVGSELVLVDSSGRLDVAAWGGAELNVAVDSIAAGDSVLVDAPMDGVRLVVDPHVIARLEADAGLGTVCIDSLKAQSGGTNSGSPSKWSGRVGTGIAELGTGYIRVKTLLDDITIRGKP